MPQRLTMTDLTGLSIQHGNFVVEYLKDFNARRAATASGLAPDTGYQLLQRKDIKVVMNHVLAKRLEVSHIDAEWLLMEAVDNHLIARQQDNLPASNTALNLIAKHTFVDALAAEKVEVNSDKEIMERLQRGRKRLKNKDDDPSFL